MHIDTQLHDRRLDLAFQGRMDAYAYLEAQKIVELAVTAEVQSAVAGEVGVDRALG